MTTHTHIGNKTLQTCLEALVIVHENRVDDLYPSVGDLVYDVDAMRHEVKISSLDEDLDAPFFVDMCDAINQIQAILEDSGLSDTAKFKLTNDE